MKKIYAVVIILFLTIFVTNAQGKVDFGVSAGVFYGNLDISTTGVDVASVLALLEEDEDALDVLDGGGFFIGLLANVEIIEDLSIQPELFYANAGGESILGLPLMIKYYFANSFNIQAGSQLDFVLDIPDDAKELVDALGFSGAVGLGYDFNDKIAIQTKYTFGFTNRLDNEITQALGAINPSIRTNTLQLGLVYKF